MTDTSVKRSSVEEAYNERAEAGAANTASALTLNPATTDHKAMPSNTQTAPAVNTRSRSETLDDDSRARANAYAREHQASLENLMWSRMVDAIAEASTPKVSVTEMLAWVDGMENRERAALHNACMINGYVPDGTARPLAVVRKLVWWLEWCIEHGEDLTVMVRAKAHMKRRRG